MAHRTGTGQARKSTGWALVVDPNTLMRESIRLYLGTLGWRAHTVADATEALAHIAREPLPPGLIVTGDADEASVFDWIHLQYGRAVPALVLTGEPDPRWIGAAQRRGVAVFCEAAPALDLQKLLSSSVRYAESRLFPTGTRVG